MAKSVLFIGGPADGERRVIEADHVVVQEFESLPASFEPIALASGPAARRHIYKVWPLHESGEVYHVAVHQDEKRPVIVALLEGYRAP